MGIDAVGVDMQPKKN
jgi:hypothetical protein